MATDHDPGATLNQKFELLEQRIAQLEQLLKQQAPQNPSSQPDSIQTNGTKPDIDSETKASLSVDSSTASANKLDKVLGSDLTPVSSSALSTVGTTEKVTEAVKATDDKSATAKDLKDTDQDLAKASKEVDKNAEEPTKTTAEERVRYIIRQWDSDAKEYKEADQSIKKEADVGKKEKSSPPRAFTYRKTFDSDGRTLESSEIDIEDTYLHENLEKVFRKVYGNSFYETWPKTFASPFNSIVHCYDDLETISQPDESDDEKTSTLKRDIQSLLETVRTSPDIEPYFKGRRESANTITFRYLWTLFPPGTEILARPFFNQWQIFRVDREPYSFNRDAWKEKPREWSLEAWCYDHNGRNYVRVFHKFKISAFEGSREINQLPCYPLKNYKDASSSHGTTSSETFLQRAIASGNKFKKFCEFSGAVRMFEYDDSAMIAGKSYANNLLKDNDSYSQPAQDDDVGTQNVFGRRPPTESYRSSSEAAVRRIKVKGRAIIDAEAFLERGIGQLLLGKSMPIYLHYHDEDLFDDRPPSDPEGDWARLCPPRILGYALNQKAMVQFILEKAQEISQKKNKGPYQNELQLKRAQKDMLLALVDQHESGENAKGTIEDIIPGKGRSLVILLHGPPGVGKTLTAEAVAEATGKPLLIVSVAEVGLNAEQAESKLERLFDLAAKWEAILLVDEADVFLESRSSDADPERNAIVSVLLRVLEYYTGTIILTTNRISSLDIAVQSRIHLSIRYNDLSDEDCIKIFEFLISEVEFESRREKKEVTEWFRSDVADEGLNGRQIRNLVTTAQTIAKAKSQSADLDCFKKVFKVTQEYQKQLTEQTARYRAENEVNYLRKR